MKSVKIIFIAAEIAAIFGVLVLAFSKTTAHNMGHYFHATYIVLFTLLAVVAQKEQQEIE